MKIHLDNAADSSVTYNKNFFIAVIGYDIIYSAVDSVRN